MATVNAVMFQEKSGFIGRERGTGGDPESFIHLSI